MRSVFPDETRSTIPSASPSRGAISTEPVTSTSSTSTGISSRVRRGIDRRDRRAGEILDPLVGRLGGHGDLEPARAEAELEQLLDARAALAHEVLAGDAAVDDAVLHVLRDVGGAHEQHVDRRVPAGEGKRALAGLLGAEPGVLEQRHGRLAQAALDRDGDRQAVDVAAFSRSSASR